MSIHTAKLKQAYLQAFSSGKIGGADIWRDLARLSHDCIKDHAPQQRAVAYGLYQAFSSLCYDFDERPVTVNEVTELMQRAHEPFLRAIEFLERSGEDRDAVDVLVAIIDLEIG